MVEAWLDCVMAVGGVGLMVLAALAFIDAAGGPLTRRWRTRQVDMNYARLLGGCKLRSALPWRRSSTPCPGCLLIA